MSLGTEKPVSLRETGQSLVMGGDTNPATPVIGAVGTAVIAVSALLYVFVLNGGWK